MATVTSDKNDPNLTDLLIAEVQKHPWIYNFSMKEFRDAHRKERSWETIASTLNMTADDCIRVWRNIRDRYSKELRQRNKRSRAGLIVTSSWPYMGDLHFLNPYIKPRKKAGCLITDISHVEVSEEHSNSAPITSDMLQCELSSDVPVESYEEPLDSVVTISASDELSSNAAGFLPQQQQPPPSFIDAIPGKRTLDTLESSGSGESCFSTHVIEASRRRTLATRPRSVKPPAIEEELLSMMKKSTAMLDQMHNPCIHFGMNVARHLNDLPSRKRSKAEAAIMQLLYDIECE